MSDPSLSTEIASLRDAYAAIDRNDIAGFVRCFDPEIVRVEPGDFPRPGTYHGIDAVVAHVAEGRGTWAEGTCEPERFVVAGDKVVVFLHVHVRLQGKTDWIDGRMADVFTFRDGKAIHYRSFGEADEAMAWAGIS